MATTQRSFRQWCAVVYQQVKVLLWPLLLILVVGVGLKLAYGRETIYFFVNRLHFPAGDVFFRYITDLGSTAAAILLTVLMLLINRRQGIVLGSAYIFTASVNFPLKFMVAFPRPRKYFEERLQDIYFVPGVEVWDNLRSFPSGHTVCAFTAATVLTYYTKNKMWGVVYLLLAALVAYSRMYLSQHFFEDVMGGAFVGMLLSMIWIAFVERLQRSRV